MPEHVAQLQSLALQAKWQMVLELSAQLLPSSNAAAALSEAELGIKSYKVLALMKLRRYSQAADELGQLGDLDHPDYQAERDAPSSSIVPFGLRYLSAELPAQLGKRNSSIDLLHRLCQYCGEEEARLGQQVMQQQQQPQQQQQQQLRQQPAQHEGRQEQQQQLGQPQGQQQGVQDGMPLEVGVAAAAAAPAAAAAQWRRRRHVVVCSLVGHYLRQLDVQSAALLLERLLAEAPGASLLWSAAGRLQLQLGDLAAAQESLVRAEALAAQQGQGQLTQHQQQQQAAGQRQGGEQQLTPQQQEQRRQGALGGQVAVACDLQRVLHHNAAVFQLYCGDSAGAQAAANAALATCAGDSTASSTKALCLAYSGQLEEAAELLQQGLVCEPAAFVQEALVSNLALLLDVCEPGSSGSVAQRLAGLKAAGKLPDDFDYAGLEPRQA